MAKRVCVFCGSHEGTRPAYAAAAREVGAALARRGLGVVFGGGRIGLMGAVADAALEAGGKVTGVIPRAMVDRELAHRGVTDLCIVNSMHERKALMADLSDAFLALPGGYGTFEEFCEVLTWCQLGIHRKPCGLLNVEGYYDSLLELFDRGTRDGFIRPRHREMVVCGGDPEELIGLLLAYQPPAVDKVIVRAER